MAKLPTQSKTYQFTVTQQALIHANKPTGFFGNFREDTGECLGVTSEQYGIVQNSALLDAARQALASRGLVGCEESITVVGKGERFYADFTFKEKQLASKVGDVFGYKLTLKNSFDRSLRAAFALGFLRLVCTNGMATLEKEFSITRKHSTSISVDFLGKAIDMALTRGQSALAVYDQMSQIAISDEQGQNILKQLEVAAALSGSLRQSIETLWLAPRRAEDKARNIYNLYNAVTEHLSSQVQAERYEYAGKVSNQVLLRLVNAARNPSVLGKLLLPVPKDVQTFVTVDSAPIANVVGADVVEAEIIPA
jgi:hypothetical protein